MKDFFTLSVNQSAEKINRQKRALQCLLGTSKKKKSNGRKDVTITNIYHRRRFLQWTKIALLKILTPG